MIQKSCVPSESSLKANCELGTKNMWGTLARGSFIYGTHMTGNITTNNMTNTQTLVILPGPKKTLPNKCHTNHPAVVKPLSKQTTKFGFGASLLRKESFNHDKSSGSILNRGTSLLPLFLLLYLFQLCMKRRKVGTAASKVMYFLFLKFCTLSEPTKRSTH